MEKDCVNEMNFDLLNKYSKPFIITFIGLPGCGKTQLARVLSKKLKIFLLSNDYIRNYYYQLTQDYSEEKRLEIQDKVEKINKERLKKIIDNKVSFVFDKCFNKKEDYDKLNELLDNNYEVIKIKINSKDEDNINNIINTKMDYTKIYEGVVGDNVEYLSSFSKEDYYNIKERIPISLDDSYADYVINNKDDILVVVDEIQANIKK